MHNFIKKEICHEKISHTCNHRNVAGFLYQFYSYISRNQPKGRFKRNHLFDIRNPWISWGCVALRNLGTRNFIEVAQKENIFQKALDKNKSGAYNTTYKLRILKLSNKHFELRCRFGQRNTKRKIS